MEAPCHRGVLAPLGMLGRHLLEDFQSKHLEKKSGLLAAREVSAEDAHVEPSVVYFNSSRFQADLNRGEKIKGRNYHLQEKKKLGEQ